MIPVDQESSEATIENESKKKSALGMDRLPSSEWLGGVAVKWSTVCASETMSARQMKARDALALSVNGKKGLLP